MKRNQSAEQEKKDLQEENQKMLYLRQYKKEDAAVIISWCRDETTFRRWTFNRYDKYPITEADMNRKYFDCNGDCAEADNFYPMTACDEHGIAGHFIMRYIDGSQRKLRLGFVIVDDTKRGCGYGKRMIRLAMDYAFRIAGAELLTIGVFDNNKPAYNCYKAAGFRDVQLKQQEVYEVSGEEWKVLELAIKREYYFYLPQD